MHPVIEQAFKESRTVKCNLAEADMHSIEKTMEKLYLIAYLQKKVRFYRMKIVFRTFGEIMLKILEDIRLINF